MLFVDSNPWFVRVRDTARIEARVNSMKKLRSFRFAGKSRKNKMNKTDTTSAPQISGLITRRKRFLNLLALKSSDCSDNNEIPLITTSSEGKVEV